MVAVQAVMAAVTSMLVVVVVVVAVTVVPPVLILFHANVSRRNVTGRGSGRDEGMVVVVAMVAVEVSQYW